MLIFPESRNQSQQQPDNSLVRQNIEQSLIVGEENSNYQDDLYYEYEIEEEKHDEREFDEKFISKAQNLQLN